MTSPHTPSLLAPYVTLPQPSSLTLVTGVLGATTNWLIVRFLAAALTNSGRDCRHTTDIRTVYDERDQEEDEVRVVLVSFSRDWTFWKGEGARTNSQVWYTMSDTSLAYAMHLHAMRHGMGPQCLSQCSKRDGHLELLEKQGVDFVRHLQSGRVTFVDGLSELFTNNNTPSTTSPELKKGQRFIRYPTGDAVERTVLDAIESAKHESSFPGLERTLLLLDGLDLYLATSGRSAQEVNDMLGEWREQVYATIVAAAADSSLIQSPITPLEMAHVAFVAGLAHEARLVMSVRGLETGVARDVSGVIRVTKVDGRLKSDEHVEDSGIIKAEALEEKEMLFFIGGDGGCKVWEKEPPKR